MIEDAEAFTEQDEAKQRALNQRNALETYLYKVSKTLKKADVKKNMPVEEMDLLFDEVEEILNWCEDNPEATADEYEKKLHDFELKAELKIAPYRIFEGKD